MGGENWEMYASFLLSTNFFEILYVSSFTSEILDLKQIFFIGFSFVSLHVLLKFENNLKVLVNKCILTFI